MKLGKIATTKNTIKTSKMDRNVQRYKHFNESLLYGWIYFGPHSPSVFFHPVPLPQGFEHGGVGVWRHAGWEILAGCEIKKIFCGMRDTRFFLPTGCGMNAYFLARWRGGRFSRDAIFRQDPGYTLFYRRNAVWSQFTAGCGTGYPQHPALQIYS